MKQLRESKHNIMVQKEARNNIDLFNNLFTVVCAIVDVQKDRDSYPCFDDSRLDSYLNGMGYRKSENGYILIEQLETLKNIIMRKSFNLTDPQIFKINKKFFNLFRNRISYLIYKQKGEEKEYEANYNKQRYNDDNDIHNLYRCGICTKQSKSKEDIASQVKNKSGPYSYTKRQDKGNQIKKVFNKVIDDRKKKDEDEEGKKNSKHHEINTIRVYYPAKYQFENDMDEFPKLK